MISSQAIHLGMFILPWTLVIILIGLFGVFLFGKFLSQKFSWQTQHWQDYKNSLWSAIWIGLLAARIAFVLIHADIYFANPIDMIKIQDKGFHLYTGIFAACLWFIWKNRLLKPAAWICSIGLFVGIQLAGTGIIQHLSVQQQYPDLVFKDLNQQSQPLNQFVGKPTVVNLWASWCPPCHREMPVLYQAQQDYPNIQFVMLNQGEEAADITEYLQRYQFNFKHVLSDPYGEMAQQMKMFGLPSTLFFDAQGQVVERHVGELTPAMLKQYLQKTIQPKISQPNEE